jgi:endoglucanase
MVFTHQAATWSYKALTMVKNVPYPVPAAEVKTWWDAAKEKGLNDKPFREAANGFNKDDMRESLHPILDFAKKEGVTLYCGEFGVHKPFTPSESRAKWTSDFVDLLNENGVGWAMWEHKANFGFLDEKGQPDPAMVKALGLQKGQ